MSKDNSHFSSIQVESACKQGLEEILRKGAQQLLQLAVEAEVHSFIEKHRSLSAEKGHHLVVRNGHHKEREILSALGPLAIIQPRVDDRKLRQLYPEIRLRTYLPILSSALNKNGNRSTKSGVAEIYLANDTCTYGRTVFILMCALMKTSLAF